MRWLAIPLFIALCTSAPAAVKETPTSTVIARFASDEKPFIACGGMAFIGVYVYDIESTVKGKPLTGRIVVDVLCPDFYVDKVKFKKGERHQLELGPPSPTYAQATAPDSPLPTAPRFHALTVLPPQ